MKIKSFMFYWLLMMAVLSISRSQCGVAQEADASEQQPLPQKLVQKVEKIIPAIRNRNENEFLQLSMPLIKSSKPEQLEIIDQMCLDRGVATVTEWFSELVVEQALQGLEPVRATNSRQMARVVLFGLADDLMEFEHNEFDNTAQKLKLANALLKRHSKALKRNGEGEAFVQRFVEIENRLEDKYKDIDERAAELRLQRFKVAYQTLIAEENQDNFELLLTSAMSLEQDGHVLAMFFDGNDSISRETLLDINLPGEISGMLASARKAGGEVTQKANLFRNGLHYWVRGRYGAGPLTGGLVKSANATSSVKAMELLSMPKLRDKPISSYHSDEETTPGYERRHYYTWAAEHRPGRTVKGNSSSKVTSTEIIEGKSSQGNEKTFL